MSKSKIKLTIKNSLLYSIALSFYHNYLANRRGKFGYIHPTAFVRLPTIIKGIENVYLHENTHLLSNTMVLATRAKFIMKKNSGAAEGLIVITGNHMFVPGTISNEVSDKMKDEQDIRNEFDKDVIIDEEVWLGAKVTIMPGVHVSRGCDIGAGTVLRKSTPPYSIIIGNPGKVVGFRYTPEEIIEHEKNIYPEEERLPLSLLENNYEKYFLNRIKDIKQFTNI